MTTPATKPAVFLDRDGVINELVLRDGRMVAPLRVVDFRLTSGIVEFVQKARAARFRIPLVDAHCDCDVRVRSRLCEARHGRAFETHRVGVQFRIQLTQRMRMPCGNEPHPDGIPWQERFRKNRERGAVSRSLFDQAACLVEAPVEVEKNRGCLDGCQTKRRGLAHGLMMLHTRRM